MAGSGEYEVHGFVCSAGAAVTARTAVGVGVALVTALIAGCGSSGGESSEPQAARFEYPAAPSAPTGPLDAEVVDAAEELVAGATDTGLDRDALAVVVGSGDARLAWVLQDLLRFIQSGSDADALVDAFESLTGVDPARDPEFDQSAWLSVTNHLIAWDLPAPPRYRETKAVLFLAVEPGWEPFFADADATIDWRLLSWGGVLIDDRRLGDPRPCSDGCIPALDDPDLTSAEQGGWYPDDAIVFGITQGAESVALPKNIMQVHEMVNITLGGRRLGVPYCTLCGSAQAYYTDRGPGAADDLVLRTSGLLSRSNKVMYDLTTQSVFDTFTGAAVSGPLQDDGFTLDQATVVVSTWAEWRAAHPETRIVAEDGGLGRTYPADPLGGRDDNGPIFPIGRADPRLPVQAEIVGVIAPDGTPIAFDATQAASALNRGDPVEAQGVELFADGGGLRARTTEGDELAAHQAFWFAWSQFHPDTIVWTPIG